MPFGGAKLLDGVVRDREVDLSRRLAGGLGGKAKLTEEALRNAVVSLVLHQRAASPGGQPGLPPVPGDQAHLFQWGKIAQSRRRSDLQRRSGRFQGDSAIGCLAASNRTECVDLAPSEPLERLHDSGNATSIYIGHPNY